MQKVTTVRHDLKLADEIHDWLDLILDNKSGLFPMRVSLKSPLFDAIADRHDMRVVATIDYNLVDHGNFNIDLQLADNAGNYRADIWHSLFVYGNVLPASLAVASAVCAKLAPEELTALPWPTKEEKPPAGTTGTSKTKLFVVVAQGFEHYGSALMTVEADSLETIDSALSASGRQTLWPTKAVGQILQLGWKNGTVISIREWRGRPQPEPVLVLDSGHANEDMAALMALNCILDGILHKR